MSRAQVEIAHLIRRLGQLLGAVPGDGLHAEDVRELRLHFAQEDEGYFPLPDGEESCADDHVLAPRPARAWSR